MLSKEEKYKQALQKILELKNIKKIHDCAKESLKEMYLGGGMDYTSDPDDIIEDGFGSAWSKTCPDCGKKTMRVVGRGKCQCSNCNKTTKTNKIDISKKWAKISKSWLGNPHGLHCHWCKHSESGDGEVTCSNKKSKYCGDRIRTWDGEECAKECSEFSLNDWYKSDKNYDKTFKK